MKILHFEILESFFKLKFPTYYSFAFKNTLQSEFSEPKAFIEIIFKKSHPDVEDKKFW